MAAPTLMQPPPRELNVSDRDGQFIQPWSGWFRNLYNILKPGITTTVALAKLTPGGTNGSLTVANGIVVSYTAPT